MEDCVFRSHGPFSSLEKYRCQYNFVLTRINSRTRNTGMESTQEIAEEIVCKKCEEGEIVSLGLCDNCLDARDHAIEDNEFDRARKGE